MAEDKKKIKFKCRKSDCALCRIDARHEDGKLEGLPYNPLNEIREFATGATRDSEEGKLDFEGFLSPAVLKRYAEYMNKCRVQTDGKLRDSDNWQKGIPMDVYMKSMFRHFMEVWSIHRGVTKGDMEEALCALNFNVMGYLYEHIKIEKFVPAPGHENCKGCRCCREAKTHE